MKTKRVLVADDDKNSLALIRATLKSANCEWLEATTKDEARDTFLRKSKNISAVVTSFIEPTMVTRMMSFQTNGWPNRMRFGQHFVLYRGDTSRNSNAPFLGLALPHLRSPFKGSRSGEP